MKDRETGILKPLTERKNKSRPIYTMRECSDQRTLTPKILFDLEGILDLVPFSSATLGKDSALEELYVLCWRCFVTICPLH
jgi:hypothetical protein